MPDEDHPLLTKRAQGAIAVLALATGLGIALMSFHLLLPGLALALAGAAGSIWIYAVDLKQLRLFYVHNGIAEKLSAEMVVVIAMLSAAILVPSAIFMHETVADIKSESRLPIRNLTEDQKTRLRRGMTADLNENYAFQVNSIGSCDECALFADEIRSFINTVPGWRANGGPLPWQTPDAQHYGLWLLAPEGDRHTPRVEKINKAFSDSGLALQYSGEGIVTPGSLVVLVGRAR